jgi:hypothetical protein
MTTSTTLVIILVVGIVLLSAFQISQNTNLQQDFGQALQGGVLSSCSNCNCCLAAGTTNCDQACKKVYGQSYTGVCQYPTSANKNKCCGCAKTTTTTITTTSISTTTTTTPLSCPSLGQDGVCPSSCNYPKTCVCGSGSTYQNCEAGLRCCFGIFSNSWSCGNFSSACPTNNAQFISQSVPTTMTAGQTYTATVTMKNTGTRTWNSAGNYRLVSQNPMNNNIWGLNAVGISSAYPVNAGESRTFSFTIFAPTTAGTYNFQWRMTTGTSDNPLGFGDFTPNVIIQVTSPTIWWCCQNAAGQPSGKCATGDVQVVCRINSTVWGGWQYYSQIDCLNNCKSNTCTYGNVTATSGLTYGNYKIFSDLGASNTWARILVKSLNNTVDSQIINVGDSRDFTAESLTLKVRSVIAFSNGTVLVTSIGVGPLGSYCG